MSPKRHARVRRQQLIRKQVRRLGRIIKARIIADIRERGPIPFTDEGRARVEQVIADTLMPELPTQLQFITLPSGLVLHALA